MLIPSWSGRETFELAEVGNNWIESLVIVKVLKSILAWASPKTGGPKREPNWSSKWHPKGPQKEALLEARKVQKALYFLMFSLKTCPRRAPIFLPKMIPKLSQNRYQFWVKIGMLGNYIESLVIAKVSKRQIPRLSSPQTFKPAEEPIIELKVLIRNLQISWTFTVAEPGRSY